MRIRATAAAAVVSGALALTGAALPAAQAATGVSASQLAQTFRQSLTGSATVHSAVAGRTAAAALPADTGLPNDLNVTFSNVKVAGGAADVSVGTTNVVHVPYTFTVTGTGVKQSPDAFAAMLAIYHGTGDADDDGFAVGDAPATCTVTSTTGTGTTAVSTANCKGTVDIHPADGDIVSNQAGPNYHSGIIAMDSDELSTTNPDAGVTIAEGFRSPGIQRYSKLTAHASASSVAKYHSVTVTGALTRANWDTGTYGGYTYQAVKLQFRKKGSTTYTTVKNLTTDGHGNLKYAVTPTASGYWRFTFAGTATTPSATATGYYVGVS